jgi:hypothetical protein
VDLSTEEGLDQDFTSLDAQREAAEAYIHSQAHAGWTCLPQRYDDGGFSGSNLDRPALQRLLAAIQAGQATGGRLSPHREASFFARSGLVGQLGVEPLRGGPGSFDHGGPGMATVIGPRHAGNLGLRASAGRPNSNSAPLTRLGQEFR